MSIEYRWRKWDGTEIDDVVKYLNNHMNDRYETFNIYVGCDSQANRGGMVTYATAIVIHKVGKGAHVIFSRDRESFKNDDLFPRLWGEVTRGMEVITFLSEHDIKNVEKMTIDFDFNELPKFKSNIVTDSAVGFAKGAGHEVRIKPDAWSATYAANKLCR